MVAVAGVPATNVLAILRLVAGILLEGTRISDVQEYIQLAIASHLKGCLIVFLVVL